MTNRQARIAALRAIIGDTRADMASGDCGTWNYADDAGERPYTRAEQKKVYKEANEVLRRLQSELDALSALEKKLAKAEP